MHLLIDVLYIRDWDITMEGELTVKLQNIYYIYDYTPTFHHLASRQYTHREKNIA